MTAGDVPTGETVHQTVKPDLWAGLRQNNHAIRMAVLGRTPERAGTRSFDSGNRRKSSGGPRPDEISLLRLSLRSVQGFARDDSGGRPDRRDCASDSKARPMGWLAAEQPRDTHGCTGKDSRKSRQSRSLSMQIRGLHPSARKDGHSGTIKPIFIWR
jgi:hypothetical protein